MKVSNRKKNGNGRPYSCTSDPYHKNKIQHMDKWLKETYAKELGLSE